MLKPGPARREFVEGVLEALPEDEARRDLLETSTGLAASMPVPPKGDALEKAAARMRETAKSFAVRRWVGQTLWIVVALLVAWFAALSPAALRELENMSDANVVTVGFTSMCCTDAPPRLPRLGGFDFEDGWLALQKKQASRLPTERRLAAFGDLSHADLTARWKAVWDAHPDDPAHFLAHALVYRATRSQWPDDFVETGERLDPENGWFRFVHAAALAEASISVRPPTIIVTDPAGFREAEEQLERALAMPRWDDYRSRLKEVRIGSLAPPRDFTEHSLDQTFHPPEYSTWDWIDVNHLADWFSIAAGDAGRAGDRERMETLEDSFRKIAGRLAAMLREKPAQKQAITLRFFLIVARSLAKGDEALGESDEALRFNLVVDCLIQRIDSMERPTSDALSERRGSSLASNTAYLRGPYARTVTEEELRGGRMAEYAMYERLLMHLLAVVLCGTTFFLLCTPLAFRGELGPLPSRVAGLLTWRDHAVLVAAAVALPSLVYAVSTRLPLLGLREFSLSAMGFFAWLVQVAALWLSVVLGAMQVGRWLLARRGAVLAFGWRGFDPGWACWLLALATMPLAATMPGTLEHWLGDKGYVIMALWALLGMPALWLVMMVLVHFNGFPERRLHRVALMHAMVPSLACASVAAVGAIPPIHAEERKWTAEMRFEKGISGPGRMEDEMADWIGREIAEVLRELER